MWLLFDVKGSHILNRTCPNIGKKSWKSVKCLVGNNMYDFIIY